MLAVTTITVGGRTADQFSGQTYFFFAPLIIPILILGVPIVDTAFSFVRRLVRRQSWSQGDREHLHHRLMRLGHGPRRSVVILWCWTALLSATALVPTYTNRGNALVPIACSGPRARALQLLPSGRGRGPPRGSRSGVGARRSATTGRRARRRPRRRDRRPRPSRRTRGRRRGRRRDRRSRGAPTCRRGARRRSRKLSLEAAPLGEAGLASSSFRPVHTAPCGRTRALTGRDRMGNWR